ncbi:MAG TPA: hypothetical protein VK447_05275 [Myxococcaceae bacterium]|nr:hypothetical protein [Myxococcaceae bacterium]
MLQRLSVVVWVTCLALGLASCGDAPMEDSAPHSERGGIGISVQALGAGSTVDARRSLAVTETAIVSQFPLQMVMSQLVTQNGGTGFTDTQLFRQLWDTQNPAPGQPDLVGGAHCTDNGGTLNGFGYPCRTAEGQQASTTSTITMSSYSAVGLYNRFDLAPSNGADCGEYRVVFANTGGGGRNFLIFEAVLPNPRTDLGLEGCRPVANFWRDLTTITDVNQRASRLRSFYFSGLSGFSPVIHINNYGNNPRGVGQVRTNQFIQSPWLLREFKLQRTCPSSGCTLKFAPVTVKTNPFGNLFNPGSTHPLAAEFQNSFFPSQVAALATNNINTFNYNVPDKFNVGQSDSQSFGVVDNYVAQFGTAASTFRSNIQTKLTAIGSTLTPDQIVARAQTQSCGGCHQRSNGAAIGGGLTWPGSANFVHSTEATETGPDGVRFQISPALTNTFLPHRKGVFESYLNKTRAVASDRFALVAVTASRGTAFWVEQTNPGNVMKAPVGGSPVALATNRFGPVAVATDGGNVYWVENGNPGQVLRVSANGGTITALAGNRFALMGVATDGTNVYWLESTNPGGIMKVPVGGGAMTAVLTNRFGVSHIAVDSANLYWVEGTTLQKMPKAGGTITTLATRVSAEGLATDGVKVYWAENFNPGNIMMVPVGGGTPTNLHSGPHALLGVGVDDTNVYWVENTNPGRVMTGPK